MKRFVLVLSLTAVMAMLLLAMAVPAFAASTEGSCIGQSASWWNAIGKQFLDDPNLGGELASRAAHEDGVTAPPAFSAARNDYCHP